MTIDDWLRVAETKLTLATIQTARLDCLVLLEDELRTDRAQILAHPEWPVTNQQQQDLDHRLVRRAKHEPLAYIRGKSEFYGRDFNVDQDVLVPRPESETIIELLVKLAPNAKTVVDVGTGSGALAISAQLELPTATVYGLDIDEKCLKLARQNAQNLTAEVSFFQGNLLQALPNNALLNQAVLLCNLPYVPDDFPINAAAKHEPHLALFAGSDGLDLYRHLFAQISDLTDRPSLILTESLPQQQLRLVALASTHNYGLLQQHGFIAVFKSTLSPDT